MTRIEQCKRNCECFIRGTLPSLAGAEPGLPTRAAFRVEKDEARNRKKFVEYAAPIWGQVPKNLWASAFETSPAKRFLRSLQSTPPFSNTIGKSLYVIETGVGRGGLSVEYIAREITRSYVLAAGVGPWKPRAFQRIWKDCVAYFDPALKEIEYTLYAPLWCFRGVTRRAQLGEGLQIRRLPSDRSARIATLEPRLAGVHLPEGLRLWPTHFFVRTYKFTKLITSEEEPWNDLAFSQGRNTLNSTMAWLNNEVALIRSLLNHEIGVPKFDFVKHHYPRDGGSPMAKDMPWRAQLWTPFSTVSCQELRRFLRRRAAFKDLRGTAGWEAVAASMRRFAIAWENPFPADSLADIVAALEALLVRDKQEVSYKLRVRAAHFIATTAHERRKICKDFADAYKYRSRIVHGDYVFDQSSEWETAKELKRAKGKHGNPCHDINEVHRLKFTLTKYYRAALDRMFRSRQMDVDWSRLGL